MPASPRRISRGRRAHLALVGLLAVLSLVASASPVAALSRAQYPVVALGSHGADVLALQRLLRHHGEELPASGEFDGTTRDALRRFQKSASLTADGVARPATWQALIVRLAPGSTGEAVRAVQEQLNGKRGAGLALTGKYDETTQKQVRLLQRRVGLARTGIVDGVTWRHLVWLFMRPLLERPLCGYELHAGRSAKWGTAGAIAQIERAGRLYGVRTGARLAVGDISLELGGDISGHATHEVGLDVDVRPARKDGRECRWGIAYTMRKYDRAGTRALIHAIRDAAPGRVKLIYFNDPVLIAEGLVTRYPNHDAHLHIRYCEVDHPRRAYRCPSAADAFAAGPASPAHAPPIGDASGSSPLSPGSERTGRAHWPE